MMVGVSAQRLDHSEPQAVPSDVPNKRDLTTWWRQFKKNTRKEEERAPENSIFGVPLTVSVKYANVAISLFDDDGKSYTYGYVPIVVAKCGVYLKEKATDIEGIFRLAGAERRIKELMVLFNSPDRYGRGLDWNGYTVHDAANLLRRYLNQLPEPIIPLEFYKQFREPLRNHQTSTTTQSDIPEKLSTFDVEGTIRLYQQFITQLPPHNRQLLLYILDLLAVFAAKSDTNRMTAPNLAAIFQPGILRHPDHDMAPEEYRLSQDVLIFLIENQDHFIVGMHGTAADEKTIQEVQSAIAPSPRPRNPSYLGRSASNASATSGRLGGIRRNASTNSRGSRQSNNSPSPITPPPVSPFIPTGKIGVQRSNTVPSKKSSSPGVPFNERVQPFSPASPSTPLVSSPLSGPTYDETPAVSHLSPQVPQSTPRKNPSPSRSPLLHPFAAIRAGSQERRLSAETRDSLLSPEEKPSIDTPTKERSFSNLFKQSPSSDGEKREGRKVNKLQKKRPEERTSQQSLVEPSSNPTMSTAQTSGEARVPSSRNSERTSSIAPVLEEEVEKRAGVSDKQVPAIERDLSAATLKPEAVYHGPATKTSDAGVKGATRSPPESIKSRSTGNEVSAQETGEESEDLEVAKREEKHHKWRISTSRKDKPDNKTSEPLSPPAVLGSFSGPGQSTSSIGSTGKPRKSFTDDSNPSTSVRAPSASEGDERATSPRRGPVKWLREKIHERREERERAKSPSAPQYGESLSAGMTGSFGSLPPDSERRLSSMASPPPVIIEESTDTDTGTHQASLPPSITPLNTAVNLDNSAVTTSGMESGDGTELATPKAPQPPRTAVSTISSGLVDTSGHEASSTGPTQHESEPANTQQSYPRS